MHISEGILSAPVLAGGAVAAAAGLALGLRAIKSEDAPQVGVAAAALFCAALIHVPLGPGSVHLVLNGLAGLLLGWAVFPAFFAALLLQALLFQFGGLTTLGVNICVMALPGVVVHYLFRGAVRPGGRSVRLSALLAGAAAVALSGLLLAGALFMSGQQAFIKPATAVLAAHVPLMAIEGVICVFSVSYLVKVRPRLLDLSRSGEQPSSEAGEA